MQADKQNQQRVDAEWPEQLAVRIARCYYELGLTQQQIAAELGIGRARVIRLLSEARARGVVTININSPLLENVELAERMAKRFSLTWCEIVLSYAETEEQQTLDVARGACECADRYLRDNITIGVGWGETLREFAKQLKSPKYLKAGLKNLVVSSLIGNLSRRSTLDQFEATTELAGNLGAECWYFPGPIVCDSQASHDVLVRQPDFKEAYQRACASDLALVSIGGMQNATMQRAGVVGDDATTSMRESGAVGNFLGYYIDAQGDVLQHEINQRVLGVQQQDYLSINQRIMISAGSSKVEALSAVLKKGLVTALITDQSTARALLNETDNTNIAVNHA